MLEVIEKENIAPLDLSAEEWTAHSLHQAYLKNGCAIVRSVVSPRLVRRVKTLITKAYEAKGNPLHIDDNDIQAAGWWRKTSSYELIAAPLLKEFLALIYKDKPYFPSGVVARRIRGQEARSKDWQPPLDLHLDAFSHDFEWTVNFWIPFDPCGEESPSLQLVPSDYKRTREFSQYSKEPLFEADYKFGYFPKGALALDKIINEFGENCFFRPKLNPGDLIISSNWIIHGTYQTAAMTKGRTSVEIRYIGTELDPN